jgi:hypothetical protein
MEAVKMLLSFVIGFSSGTVIINTAINGRYATAVISGIGLVAFISYVAIH